MTDKNTLLVVIDVQEKLLPAIDNAEYLLANIGKLINGAKVLNIPIILTEQYPKGLGKTDENIINELGELYEPVEKTTFSCYKNSNFKEALENYGKNNIVLCGIETHICVSQTAIELKNAGFNIFIAEDCVASRNDNDHCVAIQRMSNSKITISTMESIIMEMCGGSNRPEFKAISAIIK